MREFKLPSAIVKSPLLHEFFDVIRSGIESELAPAEVFGAAFGIFPDQSETESAAHSKQSRS